VRTVQEEVVERKLLGIEPAKHVLHAIAERYSCPICKAKPGEMCEEDEYYILHESRVDLAYPRT
jgi:hypothetical protein